MFRPSLVALGIVFLASAIGCRNLCGDRGSLTSHNRSAAPCQLVGSGKPMAEGCYDAITGQPVPCPPSSTVIPGGSYPLPSAGIPGSTRPDELPFPAPSDMIPRPGVPYAPPSPAPGEGASLGPKGAIPVRNGSKQ